MDLPISLPIVNEETVAKEYVYVCELFYFSHSKTPEEIHSIVEAMSVQTLDHLHDDDVLNTFIYLISVKEKEEDLWDMPNEDDEMDLSVSSNERK